jgi:hypothetical protein
MGIVSNCARIAYYTIYTYDYKVSAIFNFRSTMLVLNYQQEDSKKFTQANESYFKK